MLDYFPTKERLVSEKFEYPDTFRLISTDELEEYRGRGYLFEHIATGCQIYHVHNDDQENLFSFNFRTPPEDSSGVAHILEHSVLCGSRNFPVKDPFVSMMKGSVNTFLNAMTYPDKTLYPSASVLEKDYFNLMHVYGDAVFFPLLKKEVFRQEGHRLERDDEGNLQRVGIVYNEMKGNYSSQESIAAEWSIRSLFPDTPYGVDSGGDPEFIPSLTYEKFLEFHKTYYHPSNCRIFLYGDISSQKNLSFLEEHFLSEFTRREVDSAVPLQPDWDAPVEMEASWPSGEDDKSGGMTTLLLNWKTIGPEDPVRSLSLSILTEMLMGNSGAPLQKALLESDLGDDVSHVSGIDFDLNQAAFTIGMRGSDPDKKEAFRELVYRVLRELADKGFPEDLKESCLRLVEFRAREVKGGGPFGMRLLKKALKGWNYDHPPVLTMEFAPHMETVRKLARQKGYFEGLLKELILDNPHCSLVVVKPDSTLTRKQKEALKQELEALDRAMGAEDRELLDRENQALRVFQESGDTPEARETIPSLDISDIPREVETIPCSVEETPEMTIYRQEVFTNGILYADMAFDLSGLDEAYMPYLPLFCKALTQTGLPGISYDVITRELAMKTGGFGASVEASHKVDSSRDDQPERYFYVRLKMLENQRNEALELAGKLLLQADFDNTERLEQLLKESLNDMKASLVPGGHSYVSLRANSRRSRASALDDLWFGITQVEFLSQLNQADKKALLPAVSRVLKGIRSHVITAGGVSLSLTMDEKSMPLHSSRIAGFWKDLLPASAGDVPFPSGDLPVSPLPPAPEEGSFQEGLSIPASIGFVAASLKGTALGTPEHAGQILLSHLMKIGPLWEKIRMKGGAYGAFSSLSGLEKTFTFATYRDPHIEETLKAFRESLEEFLAFDDRVELDKSLITVIGREMRPLSPSEKGMISLKRHLYGISDELRQRKREQLMAMTPREIQKASRSLLDLWENAVIEVMAHPDRLDSAAEQWPGLKDRRIELPQ